MVLPRLNERLPRLPSTAIDAGIAAAVALGITITIAAHQESGAQADVLGYLLGIAIAVPLLVRRRWPMAVFLVSTVLLIVYHALHYPEIRSAAPTAVALYTAARAGHLRAVVAVVAAVALGGLAWLTLVQGRSLVSALGTQRLVEILLIATLLLLAEALRTREAWAAEVAERRVERERMRIARELHDVLAHTIAVIGVQAGVAAEAIADAPEEASAALRTIREKSREATSEVRAALGVLRDPTGGPPRTPAPGLAQLEELVHAAAVAGLQVDLSVEGDLGPLAAAVDLTAYRIVQESLTNVIRHAHARRAAVSIHYEPDAVVLEIKDDGHGATNGLHGAPDGHGLVGMRERAAALGGRLEAGSASNRSGFRVAAWLPTGAVRR